MEAEKNWSTLSLHRSRWVEVEVLVTCKTETLRRVGRKEGEKERPQFSLLFRFKMALLAIACCLPFVSATFNSDIFYLLDQSINSITWEEPGWGVGQPQNGPRASQRYLLYWSLCRVQIESCLLLKSEVVGVPLHQYGQLRLAVVSPGVVRLQS